MAKQRSTDIRKLPKYVGILADPNFEQRAWIHTLLLEVNPETVIVTSQTPKIDEFIEKIAVLRGDLYFKKFETDPWELKASSAAKAEKVRDYLFLSYIKYQKGQMFFFPVWYETGMYGMHYSKRMQDVILSTHQLKIPYDVIRVDKDGNDISTSY